jgi:protein required for attachment to host cells
MTKPNLPHDAIVFVGDGRKALFLRNEGDELFPNLRSLRVVVDDNPPTREQGTDRPGRMPSSAGRHSAVAATDWHEMEENRFAKHACELLARLMREHASPALAIVAPPRSLAEIRRDLPADIKAKVALELDKDLTKHSIYDIEQHIFAA